MIYFIDIDGTLCHTDGGDYQTAKPRREIIERVNMLFDMGHEITIWTARGATTDIDWREFTQQQLEEWGVKYHSLSFDKPYFDYLLDDKAKKVEEL